MVTRNKLYILLSAGIVAGYAWLIANIFTSNYVGALPAACLVKKATGIACPSCGSTRSVLLLLHGHMGEAIAMNPLGLLVAAILLIAPVWMMADVIHKKSSLFTAYRQTESAVRKPWIAITLVLLVLANWIWNIEKGL